MYLKQIEITGFRVKPHCTAEVHITKNTSCITKIILLTKFLHNPEGKCVSLCVVSIV